MKRNRTEIKRCKKILNMQGCGSVVADIVRIWLECESNENVEIPDIQVAQRTKWVIDMVNGRYDQQLKDIGKVQKSKQIDIVDAIKLAHDGKY